MFDSKVSGSGVSVYLDRVQRREPLNFELLSIRHNGTCLEKSRDSELKGWIFSPYCYRGRTVPTSLLMDTDRAVSLDYLRSIGPETSPRSGPYTAPTSTDATPEASTSRTTPGGTTSSGRPRAGRVRGRRRPKPSPVCRGPGSFLSPYSRHESLGPTRDPDWEEGDLKSRCPDFVSSTHPDRGRPSPTHKGQRRGRSTETRASRTRVEVGKRVCPGVRTRPRVVE